MAENELDLTAESMLEESTEVAVQSPFNIEDLTERVLRFCEVQAGVTLHPYQEEFGRAVIRSVLTISGEEITALFARQSGKTETISVVNQGLLVILPILARMYPEQLGIYKNGFWIGLFSPSKEQCYTTFSRTRSRIRSKDAQAILEDPEIAIKFESEKGNPMVLNNGSLLQYHSAATQSQIESKTYHLIIIEEAQDVDPMKCRKSIRPMAAAYNGTIVQIGTCNTKRSDFFDSIRQNIRSEQETKRRTHYQYDYKVAMKYNPYYKKFVMKEMKKLGYDSDEFRMAYRLHWIFERGMFTTQEALESLYDRAYKHVQMNSRDYCVVGMDIGKSEDSTVVTVGKVNWGDVDEFGRPQVDVLNWLEIVGDDHESQFEQVKDFLAPYNVQVFVIDATGKGDPVADRWANFLYGKSEVIGVTFSRQTKSDLWKNLDGFMKSGRIRIPGHAKTRSLRAFSKFESQMLDLEKAYQGQYMICQHPDTKGAHDDFCDSFALMIWGAKETALPEVEEEENFLFSDARAR